MSILKKVEQYLKGLVAEMQLGAVASDAGLDSINFNVSEPIYRVARSAHT